MKNKRFWALLIAGVLCMGLGAAIFVFGDVYEEMTDAISYRMTGNGGQITNETSLTQTFHCPYDRVNGLMMRISTLGNTYETGEGVITLADEAGKVLTTQSIPLAGIKDKSAVTVSFDPIAGTAGKTLTLTASAQGLEADKFYSLMIGQGSVGGLLTTADGKTSENNSLFLSVTYLQPEKSLSMTFFFLIAGTILLSILPLCGKKKED